ncbi:hypothetical protein ES705_07960 [subsurface metagenome]
MKPAIHYEFIAKLINRKNQDGEFEFIETRKEFHDDEPIRAREAAFRYYQNYIDVLLDAKGLKYESDKQAREVLESFHDPKTSTKYEIMGNIHEYPDSWGNGIGVYMVIDELIENTPNPDIMDMIHGIGQLWEGDCSPESLILSLEREIEYYHHFNYNTGDYEINIAFCNSDEWLEGYRDDEPQKYTILKTPFDWTGMNKPYWWGEPEDEEYDPEQQQKSTSPSRTWQELIAEGETNQVEFKAALLYNFLSKKAGISIKGIIAKSICGFLNARGGFLFIGMNDNGTPQGLSHDFSLSEDKAPRDFFRLEFDDTIKQFLPQSITNIKGQFITVDNIEIFVVIVFPSKTKPVFMNGQHGKEFWVRWTASTRQFVDIEEIANYCLENWGNKT